MILAIDAGNSRIKWGEYAENAWQRRGWVLTNGVTELAQQWAALPAPRRVVIANVAGAEARGAILEALTAWPVTPDWVTAQPTQCGVRNGYEQPERLGCDRWAALIAAWHRYRRACVVVNAGTALTVDALDDTGTFLGGMIAPGLNTMLRALAANTAGLAVAPGEYGEFPTNTADALYSGALAAMSGVVRSVREELAQRAAQLPACLLGGGDAGLLARRLGDACEVVDNPVLDGLIEIAQE